MRFERVVVPVPATTYDQPMLFLTPEEMEAFRRIVPKDWTWVVGDPMEIEVWYASGARLSLKIEERKP